MNLHLFHHHDPTSPDPILGQILATLRTLTTQGNFIMATLADIQTAETAEATAIDSELAAIADLKAQLATAQAAGADPATMQAIVDQIHANTAKLTAALPPPSVPTQPAAA